MYLGAIAIFRILAAILTIVELALTAWWANIFHWIWTPSNINFMVFNSIWSLVVVVYIGLVPLYLPVIFNRTLAFALNFLTAIFWFAGSIALAVWYGGPYDCHWSFACSNSESAIAFGFFLWAIFSFLALVDGLESLRRRGHKFHLKKSTNAYPGV